MNGLNRMRKLIAGVILFLCLQANAQTNNPYASIGKEAKVLTLSNGRYEEFFQDDTLQRIGSVIFNTRTNKIERFISENDSVYQEQLNHSMESSRWLSMDPLAVKYPSLSPYNFVANSPLMFIDPDGRYIKLANQQSFNYFNTAINNAFGANSAMANVLLAAYGVKIDGQIVPQNGYDKSAAYNNLDMKAFNQALKGLSVEQQAIAIGLARAILDKNVEINLNIAPVVVQNGIPVAPDESSVPDKGKTGADAPVIVKITVKGGQETQAFNPTLQSITSTFSNLSFAEESKVFEEVIDFSNQVHILRATKNGDQDQINTLTNNSNSNKIDIRNIMTSIRSGQTGVVRIPTELTKKSLKEDIKAKKYE
ncbi:MAG: hypothetical protein ACKOXB_05005 [Flavobacteriales bacterium]